jgi:hypothetical protein
MKRDRSEALDKSLTLLEAGSALEECLARYPEHSAELRPLLEVALQVRRVPSPTSRPAAKAAGKQRMLQALAERQQRQTTSSSLLPRAKEWIVALLERIVLRARASAFPLAWAATAALILLALVGTFLLPWIGGSAPQAATLAQVVGTVEVMPAGSAAWRSASVGERVTEGDRLRTDAFSAATLAFFNQSTTALGTDTEIVVAQMRAQRAGQVIVLYQARGQTYNQVQRMPDPASRFEIETPTAVATVCGTEFALTVDSDGATHVMVVEGVVDVTAQGSTVTVWAGQETTIQPHPSPVPVHPTLVATPTPRLTPMPQATETLKPPQTPRPTLTSRPTGTPDLTQTPRPVEAPEATEIPEPDETSEPSSSGKTPQPPGLTKTPQPPGQTKTPQPPGQTRAPEPAPTQKPKPTKKPK